MRASGALAAVLLLVPLLGACTREAPEPEPEATEIPEELARDGAPVASESGIGTPMEERVVVRLSACERTAPWEEPPETGAFVQVIVLERADADSEPEWRRIFSGWLFKNSPSLNVVEHAIYDVWVKECRMSFPNEEAPVSDDETDADAPAPAPSPSPSPTPEQAAPAEATNEA